VSALLYWCIGVDHQKCATEKWIVTPTEGFLTPRALTVTQLWVGGLNRSGTIVPIEGSQVHRLTSCLIPMRQILRRLISLPGTVIGVAASMCLASSHVWAQSAPSASGATGPSASAPYFVPIVPLIEGKVRNMVITGATGDTVEITYANTGTVPTTIVGALQVHITEDSLAASVTFADTVTVKAGATQRFRVPMPKLAKGRYVMVAVVDYGGTTMTAAQGKLDIR